MSTHSTEIRCNVVKTVEVSSANVIRSFYIKALSTQVALPWSFSHDLSKVGAIADSNTCEIWDISTGQKLVIIKGTQTTFMECAISPDGKTIATASAEGIVKLWDAKTSQELHTFNGLRLPQSLVFSPNGEVLVSGGMDGEIRMWDVETRKERYSLKGHVGQAYALAFSPDGKRLASSGDDRRIKLWDINTGREMISLMGHSLSVSGLAFSPDGSFLASSSDDKTIRLWRAATAAEVQARRGQ